MPSRNLESTALYFLYDNIYIYIVFLFYSIPWTREKKKKKKEKKFSKK